MRRHATVPLTSDQLAFVLFERYAPGLTTMTTARTVSSGIDHERLLDALEHLIARHDALRMEVHSEEGSLYQTPTGDATPRLERLPPATLPSARRRLGPPPHLHAAASGDNLYLQLSHAFCDAWSWTLLWRDLERLYSGKASSLPAIETSFGAYLARTCDTASESTLVDFWLDHFEPVTVLGANPDGDSSPAGAIDVALPSFERVRGTTNFSLAVALFGAAIGEEVAGDHVVEVPVASRASEDVFQTVGLFASMVPVGIVSSYDVVANARRVAQALAHSLVDRFPRRELVANAPAVRAVLGARRRVRAYARQLGGVFAIGGPRQSAWSAPRGGAEQRSFGVPYDLFLDIRTRGPATLHYAHGRTRLAERVAARLAGR